MNGVFVNYEFDPQWMSEYTWDSLTIYDRSAKPFNPHGLPSLTYHNTPNIGNVDYDKLTYLIEHYDVLPEAFIWGKTNLFKSIEQKEFDTVKDNTTFTPLLTQNHKVYSDKFGIVCFYKEGMYYERADGWYFNNPELDCKYFDTWNDWCWHFGLPKEKYIPFAPGGNYILTADKVRKYSRDFYEDMRSTLDHSQLPAEAHACERSYYLMWK